MLDSYHASVRATGDLAPLLEAALYEHRVPDPDGGPEGGPVSFALFPFMVEPWSVAHECSDLVVSKCTQVGWTEMALALMIKLAMKGRRVVYCLPDENARNAFVQGRLNETIERSPAYRVGAASTGGKRAQNMKMRHHGPGTLRFIGARSPVAFKDYTADTFVIDEFEQLDAKGRANVPMYKDRIRRSPHPQVFRFGNPGIAGAGIDELYQRSDRRQWQHTCTSCGTLQAIDWYDSVVVRGPSGAWALRDTERAEGLRGLAPETRLTPDQDVRPVCQHCDTPFDRHFECRWVARSPGVHRRGYTLSQMDVPSVTLWSLWGEFQEALTSPERLRRFHSGALGKPFSAEGSRVTLDDLRNARGDHLLDWEGGDAYEHLRIVAGVDVGALLNVTVSVVRFVPVDPENPKGEKRKVRERIYQDALGWDALDDVIDRYHCDRVVIDWGPELETTRKWAEKRNAKHPDQVYRCRFHTTPKTNEDVWALEFVDSEEEPDVVKVDRTALLDETFGDLRQGRVVLPADALQTPGFSEQMQAPVRTLNSRRDRWIWDEDGRPDHYRLADSYERLAMEIDERVGASVFAVDFDSWERLD